ncbi:hypothetical protein E4634_14225 [Mangrovimicrobium sediminis]|uniref:DNA gyrase subunit B n=1 Tax=Mangrovimicrobium sediminis TaxID=2562682 RepID=A0A4Z0LZL4_9GAMM|nr:hypothetical protein [Haliea sp. SAOS-164]TGD72674.1 hypothetical protein E4634_14225 [Haliea sp. SAOS-164]
MASRVPLAVLAVAVAIGYPLLVYLGSASLSVSSLALLLLGLALARLVLSGDWRRPRQYPLPLALALLCAVAIYWDSPVALQYYPVIMNLAVAALFAWSLTGSESLIEQLAGRFTDMSKKPPQVRVYQKRLTAVWALLLCANAAVAAYTACCMSPAAWALYNSLVAYLLMAAFMAGEWVFRQFYRRSLERRLRAGPVDCG